VGTPSLSTQWFHVASLFQDPRVPAVDLSEPFWGVRDFFFPLSHPSPQFAGLSLLSFLTVNSFFPNRLVLSLGEGGSRVSLPPRTGAEPNSHRSASSHRLDCVSPTTFPTSQCTHLELPVFFFFSQGMSGSIFC